MVELVEVEDEHFEKEEEGDWSTDSESDVSSVASDEAEDETVFERIAALKDVIPPAQRRKLASTLSVGSEWSWWGLQTAGKGLWIFSVSLLLIGVPFSLGAMEDQQIAMEEKQMNMQQSSNEFIAPGATSSPPQSQQSL